MYSVATEHLEYRRLKPIWQKVEDCINGEEVIKSKKDLYLPRPSGMQLGTKEGEEAYQSYIARGHFPSYVSKFLSALTGITKLNPPKITLPPSLEYLKENCDGEGTPLDVFFYQSVTESLKSGRQLLFVDVDTEFDRLKLVRYNATDIINWGVVDRVFNNKDVDFIVIREYINNSNDIFEHEYEEQYRVLTQKKFFLDELLPDELEAIDPYSLDDFVSILFDKSGNILEISTPKLIGMSIDKMPCVIIGSTDLYINPDIIPLYGISSCALQMYMKDADLSNSMFLTCNPTLCLTGITEHHGGFHTLVGSNVAITSENPDAKIYYTKTDASGLQEVRLAINMYLSEAQSMGSALLSDNPKGVESEGALRIKAASTTASLSTVAQTCARGFERAIRYIAEWSNLDSKTVELEVDTNYLDNMMTNDDITSLVKLYINDVITHETALDRLKNGNVLPEEFDINKEYDLIEKRKEQALKRIEEKELNTKMAKETMLNNHIKQTDRSQDDAIVDTKVNY